MKTVKKVLAYVVAGSAFAALLVLSPLWALPYCLIARTSFRQACRDAEGVV